VLPLEDEDAETRTVDGWKRINTLQHYNVQDNSTMYLVVVDRQRTSSVDDDEPHVVRSVDGIDSLDTLISTFAAFQPDSKI